MYLSVFLPGHGISSSNYFKGLPTVYSNVGHAVVTNNPCSNHYFIGVHNNNLSFLITLGEVLLLLLSFLPTFWWQLSRTTSRKKKQGNQFCNFFLSDYLEHEYLPVQSQKKFNSILSQNTFFPIGHFFSSSIQMKENQFYLSPKLTRILLTNCYRSNS